MRRISLLAALFGVLAVSAAFAFGGRSRPTGFRLADASAACRLQGERLVCANLRARLGVALPAHGEARPVAARIWWDASTPVLGRWSHGGLSCRTAAGVILCHNASGASIAVDPMRIAQYSSERYASR
jgi:hypothetical protein